MSNKTWRDATSWDEVCRRASGRRSYHRIRRFQRDYRRKQVCELICRYGVSSWGARARIARELGVSRATVTRDVQAIIRTSAYWQRGATCPYDWL
jgi:hypothetical protein